MGYWAMRTCRDDEKIRQFMRDELDGGRLRQGWGWDESRNLGFASTVSGRTTSRFQAFNNRPVAIGG